LNSLIIVLNEKSNTVKDLNPIRTRRIYTFNRVMFHTSRQYFNNPHVSVFTTLVSTSLDEPAIIPNVSL